MHVCVGMKCSVRERHKDKHSLSLVRRLSLSLLLSHTHTYVGNCKWLEHVGFVVIATGFSTVRISRILTLFKVHTQTLLCVCVRVSVCVCVAGWPLKKCFYCGPNMQIAWTALTTSSANKSWNMSIMYAAAAVALHAWAGLHSTGVMGTPRGSNAAA